MADLVTELIGEHFRRRYLLYIVEISHGRSMYFYVGQTGDTRVITARPVFRRLAAHLENRKSTQNQVYQYVAHDILKFPEDEGNKTAFTEGARQAVEKYLVKSNIKMYAYYLERFQSTFTPEEHKKRRRKTQKMKNQVIAVFRENGRELINKRSTPTASYADCPYPEVMKKVARDFNLTIG